MRQQRTKRFPWQDGRRTTADDRSRPRQFVAQTDSTLAQQVANQVGPRASIRAEFANVSGVRRVVASFHMDDDAYVLIGHIDADGVVRVVFPVDPRDDGFVRGNRDYRTPEFFAGFTEQYQYRARTSFNLASRPLDSYDASLGYAFIIASWRPLHVEQFQTEGRWDTFELADDKYLNDPRPAIYEMASLLVGQNREAYTVDFAKYTSTSALYGGGLGGYGGSGYSGFGYGSGGLCSSYSRFGYGYSMGFPSIFPPLGFASLSSSGYPESFYSRGQYYVYDEFSDCYRAAGTYPGYYGYGYNGYQYAGGIIPPVPEVPTRNVKPRDRVPVNPNNPGGRVLPVGRLGPADNTGELPKTSPSYRQRGLITTDDPGALPGKREPAITGHTQIENHSRPTIQEMVNRHPQTTGDPSSGFTRAQPNGRTTYQPSSTPATGRRAEPANVDQRGSQTSPSEQRVRPQPPAETRVSSPPPSREVSRPAPESRPAQESRPSPPPQPAQPASPPASSSSSGSGAPIRPGGPPTI